MPRELRRDCLGFWRHAMNLSRQKKCLFSATWAAGTLTKEQDMRRAETGRLLDLISSSRDAVSTQKSQIL